VTPTVLMWWFPNQPSPNPSPVSVTPLNIKQVEDFLVEVVDPNSNCETSFEIKKSAREFKGEEDKYVCWRKSAEIAMQQYAKGLRDSFQHVNLKKKKWNSTKF